MPIISGRLAEAATASNSGPHTTTTKKTIGSYLFMNNRFFPVKSVTQKEHFTDADVFVVVVCGPLFEAVAASASLPLMSR